MQASWKAKGWVSADYETSLQILANISFEHFDNPRRALARHPGTRSIVVDYRALTQDPHGTVKTVYTALQLPLAPQYDEWLAAQAEREKKHHSQFEYSLGEFRLDAQDIRRRLAVFYTEYDWQPVAVSGQEEKAYG